jgi:hypothetical protein
MVVQKFNIGHFNKIFRYKTLKKRRNVGRVQPLQDKKGFYKVHLVVHGKPDTTYITVNVKCT